jgi:hypothetical protein
LENRGLLINDLRQDRGRMAFIMAFGVGPRQVAEIILENLKTGTD